MKNLMEKLALSKKKINPKYDGTLGDFCTILNTAENIIDVAFFSFKYGYMQGRKATLAETKKGKVTKNRKR